MAEKKRTSNEPVPEAPSFEKSLADLEEVVKQLENTDLPLEKSIELFEQGMQLSEVCRRQLAEAETRVEILMKKGDSVQPVEFDPEEA